MMTPQQLKNSILKRAMEGRLVPQRAGEGTAKELLRKIQAEKAQLLAAKKIKKTKPLPPITEEEKPFAIPEGWEWVRLQDIFQIINGDRGKNYPAKSQLSEQGEIPFISAINIENGSISEENLLYVDEKRYNLLRSGHLEKGDLVLCIRGSLGKNGRFQFARGAIASSLVILRSFTEAEILYQYLSHYLNTGLFTSEIRKYDNGTAQPNLGARDLAKFIVPLPPLAEQHRIVAKIEELLPLIDKYDNAYTKLTAFNTRFPADMKKSLLQYAMQGKLVEQRRADGTAADLLKQIKAEKQRLLAAKKIKKTKPLPPITEEEKPFAIPDSWEWVRLGEIGALERGAGLKRSEMSDIGKPCIRYGELYTTYNTRFSKTVSHTTDEVFECCHKVNNGEILMALTGENKQDIAMALTYEGDEEIAMGGDMTKWFAHGMNPIYLTYLLNSPYCRTCKQGLATGNIIVHISNDKLSSIPLPIPPLAEQHRIAAKLEELLPLCGQLQNNFRKVML